jgi:hypothetical protein
MPFFLFRCTRLKPPGVRVNNAVEGGRGSPAEFLPSFGGLDATRSDAAYQSTASKRLMFASLKMTENCTPIRADNQPFANGLTELFASAHKACKTKFIFVQAFTSPANISKLIYNHYKVLSMPASHSHHVAWYCSRGRRATWCCSRSCCAAWYQGRGRRTTVVLWSRQLRCHGRGGCHRGAWCRGDCHCAAWCRSQLSSPSSRLLLLLRSSSLSNTHLNLVPTPQVPVSATNL